MFLPKEHDMDLSWAKRDLDVSKLSKFLKSELQFRDVEFEKEVEDNPGGSIIIRLRSNDIAKQDRYLQFLCNTALFEFEAELKFDDDEMEHTLSGDLMFIYEESEERFRHSKKVGTLTFNELTGGWKIQI